MGLLALRARSSRGQHERVSFERIKGKNVEIRQILKKGRNSERKSRIRPRNLFTPISGLWVTARYATMRLRGREKKGCGAHYTKRRVISREKEKKEEESERGDDRETRISRELAPECRFAEGASRSRVLISARNTTL